MAEDEYGDMPNTTNTENSRVAANDAMALNESRIKELVRLLDSTRHEQLNIEALLKVASLNLETNTKAKAAVLRFWQAAKNDMDALRGYGTSMRAVIEIQFPLLRKAIEDLQEEVYALSATPQPYGIFCRINDDGTIDISVDGRTLRVHAHPDVDVHKLQRGQSVVLNEEFNILKPADYEAKGYVAKVKDFLDGDRIMVVGSHGEEEIVAYLSESLKYSGLKIGDNVMLDGRSSYALEKMPKSDVEEVVLEEIPDVTYADIGGLGPQIEAIRDAIELPYLYPEEFREHLLTPPKGILLYGPPGCGKTMIAKAVANSLARSVEKKTGKKTTAYFLNVKGPELLNKYVGETEHKIREVFKKAKEKAADDQPVIIFFDEMDSIFRMRGSGVSSDIEITVVAQFLSEIDGLESLKNVIVIGASNRQDLIDPAVLRAGRLDYKIKIDRPDKLGAIDVFSKYLVSELPIHPCELQKFSGDKEASVHSLIKRMVDEMYTASAQNEFLEVTYEKGGKEIFYFKDFASGAMIENIIARGKKIALKRVIGGGQKGICFEDLQEALQGEYQENEDLPNTTNPDDWARISGKKGEPVRHVRTLMQHRVTLHTRAVEDVTGGQYL